MKEEMKKEKKEFSEDIKRKNWSPDQWKNSEDEVDRFLYWVNYLSLHNLWQARSVYREKLNRDKIKRNKMKMVEK